MESPSGHEPNCGDKNNKVKQGKNFCHSPLELPSLQI